MTRQIAFLVYPGFQILDAAGPLAAFEAANAFVPAPTAALMSRDGGLVASSGGACLATAASTTRAGARHPDRGRRRRRRGGGRLPATWLRRPQRRTPARIASVCSGLPAGAAGLLDGRRATTHWRRSPDFARRFPAVRVEADRIFTRTARYGRRPASAPASTWRWR
jgi:transcriptional regulator GlxA family with amidase domain